ncbi:MAG: LysR family transcriptional regulator [Polyangiales bacterium]
MEPHLASLDLNLLVALDALLQEGSVTRAARRLGLSQPATSHALARLRELFGDPLLVRVGRGLAPTPRAEALRAPLERVLADVRRLLRERPAFDPATSRRRFVLLCPDLLAPLLPELLTVLEHDAPGVDLAVEQPRGDIHGPLEEGRATWRSGRRVGVARACSAAGSAPCAGASSVDVTIPRGVDAGPPAKWLAHPTSRSARATPTRT